MPANNLPIVPAVPRISFNTTQAFNGANANTATDGTGANSYLVFTAGSNGSALDYIKFKSVSTTAATVIRVFYCSDTGTFTAGTTNTSANSVLIAEIAVAAWTASNTSASPEYTIPLRFAMPANTKLFITFGTSTGASTTGFAASVYGGDY